MFAAETKAVLKQVGGHGALISNKNLNEKMDLLTLVKVTEGRIWPVPKYQAMEYTLPELMEESEFTPGFEEEVLVNDFTNTVETSQSGKFEGAHSPEIKGEVSANSETVDGAATPVCIMRKKANIRAVRNRFGGRKLIKNNVDMLGLKDRDKLMFVYQTIYNTGPVKLARSSKMDGSIIGSCHKMFNMFVKGSKKEQTSFTVPEKSTFAYGLMEITGLQEENLNISCEPWGGHRGVIDMLIGNDSSSDDTDSTSCTTVQQVKKEIKKKEHLLQPLADFPESTRQNLLKSLSELLEDRDALTLLEQTLDQRSKAGNEPPKSQGVSSFVDFLDDPSTTSAQKDAAYMLVSAMDTLPDDLPALLTSCSPDTLRVLNQLVDSLNGDTQTKLPESLPPPLQEDGELRWVVELLCSTNQTLEQLSDRWDQPDFPPGVMLEVLSLAVRGLSLMQTRTDS
ncbi:hypothetical protein Q5P01_024060 [Channa striata]|uniref:Uncharacterized protein n=1 Tax=Channa striata TaxID=64152 RepID=A0AA88LPQ6_CHASR|nr:hypothetical protein Q5P01_024060 [Channa striata]